MNFILFIAIQFSIFLNMDSFNNSYLAGMKKYTYLALGDSYTIGESVPAVENFPNQTVQLLKKAGYEFESPEIVAKTGWTTDELQGAIHQHQFRSSYDFVTLLIGVNNQYRGRSVEEYKPEFESLLQQAIQFAGNEADHVIVLSIPDWGVTPFAAEKDRTQIAKEIDAFNEANKKISGIYKVHYIDITTGTREATFDRNLIASDGLHPSGKEYSRWAEKLKMIIESMLK
ncbi:MAG TPA: SGNH/GDSL hydrolase family protein [Chitinophagaceae bacterium]|jgi:lysophospholipase L1-like esterase|nr:SGNH/GDSL hydrolase family protein [Chitinophagaceae bacterium]